MGTTHRVRRIAPALLVVAAVGAAAACEPAPCDEPYRPFAADPEANAGDWPSFGTERDNAPPPALDTDGDGASEALFTTAGGGLRIDRPGPDDLVIDAPGTEIVSTRWGALGDLDGDGRSEVGIDLLDASGALIGVYAMPGTLTSGTHDPQVDGVLLGGPDVPAPTPVGDLDDDGRDDLVTDTVRDGTQDTAVWYGLDLGSAPAGGLLTGTPSLVHDGRFESTYAAAPGVVGLITLDPAGTDLDVRLVVRGVVRTFTTVGSGVPIVDVRASSTTVVDGARGELWLRHVNYSDTADARFAWDLRDLCAGSAGAAP